MKSPIQLAQPFPVTILRSGLIIAALFLLVRLPAEPGFVGVYVDGQRTFFLLADSSGAPPRWLRLGQGIDGLVIRDYEPTRDALVVERDGIRATLFLRASKVQDAALLPERFIAAACRDVAARDGWGTDVQLLGVQPCDGDYRVIIGRTTTREARLIILSPQGAIKDYWQI